MVRLALAGIRADLKGWKDFLVCPGVMYKNSSSSKVLRDPLLTSHTLLIHETVANSVGRSNIQIKSTRRSL